MDYELGVLGGMGSLATEVFFHKLITMTQAHCDQDHINTIILNHAAMPDRSEVILKGEPALFLDRARLDFDLLNSLALKAIAIPCNTSHYFYQELSEMSQAPIINMVEETVRTLQAEACERAVIFGTQGLLQAGVYDRYAKKWGLELVPLEKADRAEVMRIIYQIKAENGRVSMDHLLDKYEQKGRMVLACTELSTLGILPDRALDAMDVLVTASIQKCGKEVKA